MKTALSRKQFLKLGAAGVGGLAMLGVSERNARGRTVRRASVTQPPYNCRGDGSDESGKIQKCINENDVIVFPTAPAGVGYGVDPTVKPLIIPSNKMLVGSGERGKIIRVGPFPRGKEYRLIRNRNTGRGNNNITFRNLYIDGRKGAITSIRRSDNWICLNIVSERSRSACHNIRLESCRFVNWPGTCVRMDNVSTFHWLNNYCIGSNRGGLVGTFLCSDGIVKDNTVKGSGDDCVAFNAASQDSTSAARGAPHDIHIVDNFLEMRPNQTGGCPIALRGASSVTAAQNRTRRGADAAVLAREWFGFIPRDISILDNNIRGSQADGVLFVGVRGGKIYGNTITDSRGKDIALKHCSDVSQAHNT